MARIMIVDDSPMLRAELRQALESGSHQVVEMESGQYALDHLADAGAIDLVVTDYNMPDLDGLNFVKKLRTNSAYATTPVFVLTTEASPALQTAGKEVGVTLWFVKPFNKEKILQAVGMVLAKMQKSA